MELLVRAGRSYATAADAAGIAPTTWARWRRQAKAGDPELAVFFGKVDRIRLKVRRERRQAWSFDRLVRQVIREAGLEDEDDEEQDEPLAVDEPLDDDADLDALFAEFDDEP